MKKLAHDVAQFITVINGQVELIERHVVRSGLQGSDDLLLRTRDIRESARLIFQCVKDAAGRVAAPTAGLSLNQVVEELSYLSVLRRRVTVQLELGEDLPALPPWTPESTLHRALMNICSNAKHAMENSANEAAVFDSSGESEGLAIEPAICGVLTIRTGVTLWGPGVSALTVSVTDTGPGMTAFQKSRLLARMRGGAESISEGHGYGMQIVHAFTEEMGGRVSLRSAPGEGTTFTLMLPLERGTVAA